MNNDLIYVYCISDTPPMPGNGIDQDIPGVLEFEGFHVVIKIVSDDVFSEENFKTNIADVNWLETNVRDHIGVIGRVMKNNTIIPFKFGTIYQTEASLGKFINEYAVSLRENFLHLAGMEEWSVKVYCDRKALRDRIDEYSEEAAEMEKQIMSSSPGKAFLIKRKKTELVENEIDRLCKNYGQNYYNGFAQTSESAKLNNLIPREYTGRDDSMILNATFLVSKKNIPAFEKTSDDLTIKDTATGFSIETTGPWPPFSFISLKEIQ